MNELVPVSYDRAAWNTLHGTELQAHNDALTAEQAARINNQYDMEIYVGRHGLILDKTDDPYSLAPPSELEYNEVAAVVDDLEPGDTLFVEGYGFDSQPDIPLISSESFKRAANANPDRVEKAMGELRHQVETAKRDQEITAWEYARLLAEFKGVQVVFADHDAFEESSWHVLSEGRDPQELIASRDPEDRKLKDRIHTQRELKARNTVKDWALDHPSPRVTQLPDSRKPKLAMLYGGYHGEKLKQAFDDIGLNADVVVMKSTSDQERIQDRMIRTAAGIAPLISASTRPDKSSRVKQEPHETAGLNGSRDRSFNHGSRRFGARRSGS